METPQSTNEGTQEPKRKRSPLLIIILILLLLLVGCCIIGAVFCRGSSRLPDIFDWFSEYVLDPDSDFGDIWSLVEDNEYFPDLNEITPDDRDDKDEPVPSTDKCVGLSGYLEMQVLVGPAEVVGLEPLGIGNVPFSVETVGGVHIIEGEGTIIYQEVLEEVWGTYTVSFDSEAVVNGVCIGTEQSGILNLIVETSGEQLIVVEAEHFQGEYPWSGTHEFNLSFPIEEGAISEGEGWAFVLHLNE